MNIEHDQSSLRFVINKPEGEAYLAYRYDNSQGAVDFYSTFVPPDLRSQGLAEKLVRHGIAWAMSENLEIKASCWYAAKFIA